MFVCFLLAVCVLLVSACCFLVFVFVCHGVATPPKLICCRFLLLCVLVLCCFCFLICCCFVVQFCCVCSFFKKWWWWWCCFGDVVLGLPTNTKPTTIQTHLLRVMCDFAVLFIVSVSRFGISFFLGVFVVVSVWLFVFLRVLGVYLLC